MTKRENGTTKKVITDVAVVEKKELAVPGIFKDIDFNGLNAAINKIAERQTELSKEEKAAAVDVVNSWNKDVIERLKLYTNEIKNAAEFIKGDSGKQIPMDMLNQLLAVTDTAELYDAMKAANKAVVDYQIENKPEQPLVLDDMNALEILETRQGYDLEMAKFNIEVSKLKRKAVIAKKTFFDKFSGHDVSKAIVEKAEAQVNNQSKFANEANTRATMAKLNIQVSSKETREALRSLLDFATTI